MGPWERCDMRHRVVLWLVLAWLVSSPLGARAVQGHLYALCFAHGRFPSRYVTDGGVGQTRLAFYCFVWRAGTRTVLIDCGFRQAPPTAPVRIDRYTPVADMLGTLGVRPADVTDVVLTHGHWDHAGGLDLFPAAHLWMGRQELAEMQRSVSPAKPYAHGYSFADLQAVTSSLARHGTLVEDVSDALPGLRLLVAGGHTPGMLTVLVNKRWALVGDNAYLFRNLANTPIARISRAADAPDALPWIRRHVGSAVLIPGHDPLLLSQYPLISPGVVEIR